MKLTPEEIKIMEKMQPGIITIYGFLGSDQRHIHEIIEDDLNTLSLLGYTKEQVADRLDYFTEASKEAWDKDIIIDNKYSLWQENWRGLVVCPFNHRGTYKKASIKLKNLDNNIEISWTPLHIHMIREHGFFEGKDSHFRIDPSLIIQAIF